jgi:hypothetical protein
VEVGDVSEREDRPSPQTAEQIIELTETRKSLDSFNPAPPVPVVAQMASMQTNIPGDGGNTSAATPMAQAPMDADG